MKNGKIKRIGAALLGIGLLLGTVACNTTGNDYVLPTPVPEVRIEPTAVPTVEATLIPIEIPWQKPAEGMMTTNTPEPTAPDRTATEMPLATMTNTPVPTKAPTATCTSKPTKAPTAICTPVPTKAPTVTPIPETDTGTGCRYEYTEHFAQKQEGRLREDSYMKSEAEVYAYLLEQVMGRANKYFLTFGAASSEIVEGAAKRLTKLPGMQSVEVQKKEYWSNGAAFYVTVSHVPEFVLVYAWVTGDTSELSSDGLRVLNKAKEIAAEADRLHSDYEKVVYFHDYLVLNTVYDTVEGDTVGQTAYGALVDGRCVCMGYTNAFHLLLTMAGIDSLIVSGEADGVAHAWNKVNIDGAWYNVDVTWDDPVPDVAGKVGYAYLNVTDAWLAKTHTWDNTNLPVAKATEYYYLELNVPTFSDMSSIIRYCKECLAAGTETAEFICNGITPEIQTIVEEVQCGISYRITDCQSGTWYRITLKQ